MTEEFQILKGIQQALENIFIYVDDSEIEKMNIDEYIKDSLQFMSFIVQLENVFSIEFPAEILIFDNFAKIENIKQIISELVKKG